MQERHTETLAADYVIVGAGTAGLVLARRLSGNPDSNVILVEAAGRGNDALRLPHLWPLNIGSDSDPGSQTKPQFGLAGRAVPYPSDRVVDGSSRINGLTHVRAPREDFDAWTEVGGPTWSYERLEASMARVESRGEDGGVSGGSAMPPTDFTKAVARALRAHRNVVAVRLNGFAGHDDARPSEGEWHLPADVRERRNVRIFTGSTVRRVVFDAARCVGVDIGTAERPVVVRASREVILSAGAIGSPQLLMLSGIGPSEHLRHHGIEVRVDAPAVGSGLTDHPEGSVTYATNTAPPSRLSIGELSATMRSTSAVPRPDLQFLLAAVPYHPVTIEGPPCGFTVTVSVMQPASRGTVRLAGSEVETRPEIDPALLSDPRDVECMVSGIRVVREAIDAADLSEWGTAEALPGARVVSSPDLQDYARDVTWSSFHPMGTCALGDDSSSVVDERLSVRGVVGLRVIDASVMPAPVSVDPTSTVSALAEYGAQLISEDWA